MQPNYIIALHGAGYTTRAHGVGVLQVFDSTGSFIGHLVARDSGHVMPPKIDAAHRDRIQDILWQVTCAD